jgi:hypothetical protein
VTEKKVKLAGPGIYIVTLNNIEPISVNADRPKIAEKCIKVTKENVKVGKAKSLGCRKRDYFKTFGEHNVNFYPVVNIAAVDEVENQIMAALDEYRVIGETGRKNEWLKNISFDQVKDIVNRVLQEIEGVDEILPLKKSPKISRVHKIAKPTNTDLFDEFYGYINSSETQAALQHLYEFTSKLSGFDCYPVYKGIVRDFRLFKGDTLPFSCIVNKTSLLFYIRKAGLEITDESTLETLRKELPCNKNKLGEYTVRLQSESDVKSLLHHLFR